MLLNGKQMNISGANHQRARLFKATWSCAVTLHVKMWRTKWMFFDGYKLHTRVQKCAFSVIIHQYSDYQRQISLADIAAKKVFVIFHLKAYPDLFFFFSNEALWMIFVCFCYVLHVFILQPLSLFFSTSLTLNNILCDFISSLISSYIIRLLLSTELSY